MRTVIFALTGLLVLPGCQTVGDTFAGLNPFAEEEEILPGERRSLRGGGDPVAAVAATTVAIPSASGAIDWPQPGGNAANNPGHVALSGTASWRANAGIVSGRRAVRMAAMPVVSGGRAFVYDPSGNVTSVALSGGGQSWRSELRPEDEDGQIANGGVAVSGERVVATTGFGQVFGLSASNGGTLWVKDLDTPALSAPTIADGRAYFIDQSNTLIALSLEDGTELWRFRGVPATAGILGSGTPAFSGGTLIVPYSSGEVLALDAATGDLRWGDAVTTGSRYNAISGLRDLVASPVIASGAVIATGVGGRTISVGLSSGDRQWEVNVGSLHTPIVAGDVIFMVDLEGRALALSRTSGVIQWATQLPTEQQWAGPALASGTLFFASDAGNLIRLDPTSGQVQGGATSLGKEVYMRPIAAGGRLLVLAGDGTLIAAN